MAVRLIAVGLLGMLLGCGEKSEEWDCYTNEDCEDGQSCVISHDHEGDDHSHGGDCVADGEVE